jgi:hypothetical protein
MYEAAVIDANPIPAALELLDYFGIAVFAVSASAARGRKDADAGHLHLLRCCDRHRRRVS